MNKEQEIEIKYEGEYGEQHIFKGNVGQCIRYLVKLTT